MNQNESIGSCYDRRLTNEDHPINLKSQQIAIISHHRQHRPLTVVGCQHCSPPYSLLTMVASCFIRRAVKPLRFAGPKHASIRNFSFTFNGAKTLDEIIHKDLLQDKTGAEVADVWYSYHESKVRTDAFSDFLHALQ
jgi:hypothetical protein